ncbi:MAG TPA: UMP kinase [Phycisphaerae bacterium]|nr:UMP kinase [Phycisphaerae bacterium]
MAQAKPVYKRVLLKLSGEGLAGSEGFGISRDALQALTAEIREVHALGVELAIVVGGGNILRGNAFARNGDFPEATAHYMGMLATVMNALALREALEAIGIQARVLSALPVNSVCETFYRLRCLHHLEKGRVAVLAGGTGRPFVTTDTAAALGAAEISAQAVLKATQVDGVYTADPKKDPKAKRYDKLTYDQVINDRLAVMDLSAIEICQRCRIPIVVFNLHKAGNLKRVLMGEPVGTSVTEKG